MKQLTVGMLALTVAVTAAGAQDPTPPARPVRPSPAPAAPRTPRPPVVSNVPIDRYDFDFNFDFDVDRLRDQARELARQAAQLDREQVREMADQARDLAREQARMQRDLQRMSDDFVHDFAITPMPPMEVHVPSVDVHVPMVDVHVPAMDMHLPEMGVPMGTLGGRDFTDRMPAAPWVQGDPADSLYRAARDALIRGDYGRAARQFSEIVQKYPKSVYFSNAQYYEALARYKVGTTDDLRQAARILEPLAKTTAV
ncbi:MAG TPA: outer membrane protein assembly factor BamD, partial [Gemmatimonadaceae bacterium]|nr:outer membrane protein assembly factor BamD [Gemmatimonadaceae bacterium]